MLTLLPGARISSSEQASLNPLGYDAAAVQPYDPLR
jgi:hypothetical protein